MKKLRGWTHSVAIFSGYFFAMLFGSISPKKNTTMVVTMVEMVTALKPHFFVTYTVTIPAVAMWTMFVQISSVVMA